MLSIEIKGKSLRSGATIHLESRGGLARDSDMADAARKEELPASVQTYNRSVEEIAAKVGRTRDADPKLTEELSRRVKEQATEIADFILDRAREKKR